MPLKTDIIITLIRSWTSSKFSFFSSVVGYQSQLFHFGCTAACEGSRISKSGVLHQHEFSKDGGFSVSLKDESRLTYPSYPCCGV